MLNAAAILVATAIAADPEIVAHELNSFLGFGVTTGEKAYSAGATWCNLGDANAAWDFGSNQHPISALNLLRIENGAIRHLGASWATHQFCALQSNACATCTPAGPGCPPALGVGCSTSSTATSLSYQPNMSKRSDANAATGEFAFPFSNPPTSSSLDRRCRVLVADIDPAIHSSATFAFELVTLHPSEGDASARCVTRKVVTSSMLGSPLASGPSNDGSTALELWRDLVPSVTVVTFDLPGDGRVQIAGNAFALPGLGWRYDYAIANIDSHVSFGSIAIPRGPGVDVSQLDFHAPLAHSGEVTSNDPWLATISNDSVEWATDSFQANENANAVRWGTTYTFSFISSRPPVTGLVAIGLFRSLGTIEVPLPVPESQPGAIVGDINGDGTVDAVDLSILLAAWGPCARCAADLDEDGSVGSGDLAILLGAWS
jgi:hypothetical protein